MSVRVDPEPRSWAPADVGAGDVEIRAILAEGLSTSAAFDAEIRELRREPSPFATLSPADFVHVRLADGRVIDLFVKYPGRETAEHPDKVGPLREIRLYGGALAEPGLPVPRCYAVWRSERLDRWVLALERIQSWDLRYLALAHWRHAASGLADLHRRFGQGMTERLPTQVLRRFDTEYYAGWLECAAGEVTSRFPRQASRVTRLLRAGRAVPAILGSAPPSLVHNDLSPKNVLVEGHREPGAVRIVDWEMAGIGAAALDPVHLAYGLPPRDARRLLDRWIAGLKDSRLLPSSPHQRGRVFAAAEGFKVLYRAAHCRRWRLSETQVEAFLSEAEAAFGRL